MGREHDREGDIDDIDKTCVTGREVENLLRHGVRVQEYEIGLMYLAKTT